MSKGARRELLLSLQPQYRAAAWRQKQELLDGFVAATGYDRKYATALLNREVTVVSATRERKRQYGDDIREALLEIWRKAGNRLCSKRLVPILPVLIEKMIQFGHLLISDEQKAKLLSLSAATIDRLLKPERVKHGRGRSTTKPGYLIKKHIPIRTFADWNDAKPGFLEADLVAHCGDSVHGQFLNTLTVTDIATTWTETAALLRRSEADVMHALTELREQLPFSMLGVDTDNGGEFINYTLLNWCKQHGITFTRSREYKKNDQAHVEQKNGSVVRRLVGYDRYEGVASWQLLSTLYRLTRLYVNFFQPSLKLLAKSRDGARVHRRYEKAQTPFDRVLKSPDIPEANKARLRRDFDQLDPVLLLSDIESLQIEFWRTAVTPGVNDVAAAEDTQSDVPTDSAPGTAMQHKPVTALPQPRRRRADRTTPCAPQSGVTKKQSGRKSNLGKVWHEVCGELELNPALTGTEILNMLEDRYPGEFRKTQISTVGDKLNRWRSEHYPGRIWPKTKTGRKSFIDHVWPQMCTELEKNPTLTNRGLLRIFSDRYPERLRMTQRSTLVKRLKGWRAAHLHSVTLLPADTASLNISESLLAQDFAADEPGDPRSKTPEPGTARGDTITNN